MMSAMTLLFVIQLFSGDPSAAAGGSFDSSVAVRDSAPEPIAITQALDAPAGDAASPLAGISRIPAATTLADLRAAAGPHAVRLTTSRGAWIIHGAAFDSSGVRAIGPVQWRPARSAVIQLSEPANAGPMPEVVPWSEIERIEVGRSQWRRGVGAGALLWAVVAVATYPLGAGLLFISGEYPLAGVLVIGSFVAATAAGAALAAPSKDWSVVWEPPGSVPWMPEPARKRKR